MNWQFSTGYCQLGQKIPKNALNLVTMPVSVLMINGMDHQAQMYRRLSEVGMNVNFSFLRGNAMQERSGRYDLSDVTEYVMSHEAHDAFSAITKLWQEHYPSCSYENLNLSVRRRPNWLKRKAAMLSCTKSSKEQQFVTPLCSGNFWEEQSNTRVLRVLSTEETSRLLKIAKDSGMGFSLYVLYKLHDAVVKLIGHKSDFQVWSVPVSLHQDFSRPRGNQSVFVNIPLENKTTPEKLVNFFNDIINRDLAWGVKDLIPHVVGVMQNASIGNVRKSVARRSVSGSLTNLGNWKLSEEGFEDDIWWFSSPVASFNPINCGIITVNGRMSLALNVLDELQLNNNQIDSIVDSIVST